MLTFGLLSLTLLGVALCALIIAFACFPRKRQPLYRIDRVLFHDGTTLFYIMRRAPFNRWVVFEPEPGVRSYPTLEQAENALEDYLSNTLNLEMSESITVKEYG